MASKNQFLAVGFNVPKDQSLRKSLQRFRWFKSTFEEQVEAISVRTGIKYQINTQILTECFLDWIRQFEAAKPTNPDDRYSYVGHTSGKMLRQLIVRKPLEVVELPKATNVDLPEYFWPEGFVYVSYCLNVRRSVLRQDFDIDIEENPALTDIRTWWSFKENVNEMPDYAISFLDLFSGEEPNWTSPSIFSAKVNRSKIEGFPKGRL